MSSPYKTVAFHTLGCKLNFSETSTIARDFQVHGYSRVEFSDPSHVYVINTCSVTDNADKKARKVVRQALKRSPKAFIAIIGCYAQLKPEEIANISGVNLVLGAQEKFNLPEHIDNYWTADETVVMNSDIGSATHFNPSYSMGDRTRTFLKIQDGCDYSCTYCTIPMARGKSRSGIIAETVSMAEKIAQSGIEEVVLTGVNIGDFGVNTDENFLSLVIALDKIKGISRYRISSIEPNLLSDDVIHFVSNSDYFLPHFHVPLQSGSNTILSLMKRRYQRELYVDRVRKIRELMPSACIGADVIVGFPGETEAVFLDSYHFINDLDVNYLHIFTYSERDNTEALHLTPIVSHEDRIKRSKMLHILSDKKRMAFRLQNQGTEHDVLFENEDDGILSGLTDNYLRIRVPGDSKWVNKVRPVSISTIKDGELQGTIIT